VRGDVTCDLPFLYAAAPDSYSRTISEALRPRRAGNVNPFAPTEPCVLSAVRATAGSSALIRLPRAPRRRRVGAAAANLRAKSQPSTERWQPSRPERGGSVPPGHTAGAPWTLPRNFHRLSVALLDSVTEVGRESEAAARGPLEWLMTLKSMLVRRGSHRLVQLTSAVPIPPAPMRSSAAGQAPAPHSSLSARQGPAIPVAAAQWASKPESPGVHVASTADASSALPAGQERNLIRRVQSRLAAPLLPRLN
jgi:hypothetical protein